MKATFPTPATDKLGIRYPIVQAPIGACATPELAAAVTNAGGLGMLAVSWDDPETLAGKIRATQRLTDGSFGINLGMAWDQTERVEMALALGVPVISFFWGDPSAYMPRVRAAGALTMHTVGSPEEAHRSAELGVDILVCQGFEAGGHVWSRLSTMVLVPLVVHAIGGSVPVIAAGGIADGRGLAAALVLGAAGVWLGTRFLASFEASAHPLYKEMIVAAKATDTVYTTLFDGGWPNAPHRVVKNSTYERWAVAEKAPPGTRPGEGEVIGYEANGNAVRRYEDLAPTAGATGDVEAFSLYAGQSVGLVTDIRPVSAIIDDLVTTAKGLLNRRY